MNDREQLMSVMSERAALVEKLAELDAQRDELIASLFHSREANGPELAELTGMTTAGVYKIRNRQTRAAALNAANTSVDATQ